MLFYSLNLCLLLFVALIQLELGVTEQVGALWGHMFSLVNITTALHYYTTPPNHKLVCLYVFMFVSMCVLLFTVEGSSHGRFNAHLQYSQLHVNRIAAPTATERA